MRVRIMTWLAAAFGALALSAVADTAAAQCGTGCEPPPPPCCEPPPPPPPPPPDVAVVFKQGLLGIERDPATGQYRAMVRDPAHPGPQIRLMAAGETFGDKGWRIEQVSEFSVTLRKGRETRVVRLFG